MSTTKYLCATMAALALAGCGSDDGSSSGGSGKSSSSTVQPSFNGTGTEVEGYFTFKVTAASGIFQDQYYAPKGYTGQVELYDNGDGSITLRRGDVGMGSWRNITLDADTATKTYQGSVTYVISQGGDYDGEDIDEVWTLNFNGAIANLTVTGGIDDDNDDGTPPIATGSLTMNLQVPYSFDDNQESYFYGKVTSFSSDSRYVGQTGVAELYDWGPGTYLYYYWDGGYNWNDSLYLDGMWKEGNTLTGGGYYDGSYGDWMSKFGTVSIQLDTAGKPVSSSAKVWDTATDAATTMTHANYKSEGAIDQFIDDDSNYHDLIVTSVTAGGTLESVFGVAGTINEDEFYSHGGHLHTNLFPGNVNGYRDGNSYAWVLWDEPYYVAESSTPYDMDNDSGAAYERISVKLTVSNRFFTGGTATFRTYDPTTGALIASESMSFTCDAKPVINSALTDSATSGAAYSYNITHRHSADSFNATGLPTGLSINTGTGAISGTPTVDGVFNIVISATNDAGTDTETLVLTIAAP